MAYKKVRNHVNKLIESAKKQFYLEKLGGCNKDMKNMWESLNMLLNKGSETANVNCLQVEDREITNEKDICNALNYFVDVGNKLSESIPEPGKDPNSYIKSFNGLPFQFRFTRKDEIILSRLSKLLNPLIYMVCQ